MFKKLPSENNHVRQFSIIEYSSQSSPRTGPWLFLSIYVPACRQSKRGMLPHKNALLRSLPTPNANAKQLTAEDDL